MQVKFFNHFSKAPNSTKIPASDYSDTQTIDGEIKGDFSPLAPVMRFQTLDVAYVPQATYAYIAKFGRYYFCTWAFVSGVWECSFKCDALASFRSLILNTTQFVQRSASEKDGFLIDANYPTVATAGHAMAYATQEQFWGTNFFNGTVIVSVVNSTNYNIGANTYYAMTYLGFRALMYALLNSPNWMQIDTSEISAELQKALINPAQYITSAVWLPISASAFVAQGPAEDKTTIIKFGWWEFDLQTTIRILHAPFGENDSWSKSAVFLLTNHPQMSIFGEWLNLSPYRKVTLEFPPFGTVDIDTTDLCGYDRITVRTFIHSYTGDALLYVYAGEYTGTSSDNSKIIASLQGCVGINLPVGQIRIDANKYKSALIGGAVVGAVDYFGKEEG